MIKLASVAGLALALSISSTFAADLPSLKAPIVAPPPAFSWTGLYGGVNIGYGFGNSDRDPGWLEIQPYVAPCCTLLLPSPAWSISNDPHGVLGGGQVGYNFQFNPWLVFGLEAEFRRATCTARGTALAQWMDTFLRPEFRLRLAKQERRLVRHGAWARRRDFPQPAECAALRHGRPGLWRRGPQRQRLGLLSFCRSPPRGRPHGPARVTIRRRSAGRPAAASSGSRCPRIRCGAPFPSSLNISTLTLARRRSMVRLFPRS